MPFTERTNRTRLHCYWLHPDWFLSHNWVETLYLACGGTLTIPLGIDVVTLFASTLELILWYNHLLRLLSFIIHLLSALLGKF